MLASRRHIGWGLQPLLLMLCFATFCSCVVVCGQARNGLRVKGDGTLIKKKSRVQKMNARIRAIQGAGCTLDVPLTSLNLLKIMAQYWLDSIWSTSGLLLESTWKKPQKLVIYMQYEQLCNGVVLILFIFFYFFCFFSFFFNLNEKKKKKQYSRKQYSVSVCFRLVVTYSAL